MIVRLATQAMGTRFELVLDGADETMLRAAGEDAIEAIEDRHRRYSAFDPASLLSYVNAHAAARPVRIDDDLVDLLDVAATVWRDSGGAFDITVAPAMQAWGFRAEPRDHAAVATLPERVGMGGVIVDADARTVRFARPGMALDLGGIAKGDALDAAAAVLRGAGVTRALLHGGTSTVVAIGAPPGAAGWTIALAGTDPAVVVDLRDGALSVSAPHGRTVTDGDVTHGHVIDPRHGAPATVGRLAATLARDARTADAWSTALLVLGARPAALSDAVSSFIVPTVGTPRRGGRLGCTFRDRAPVASSKESS